MKPSEYVVVLVGLFALYGSPPDALAPPPSTPNFHVALTATNTLIVAWNSAYGGVSLVQRTDINSTNWVSVTNIPKVVGQELQVIIDPTNHCCFFRLRS
jgi:hypothetical protein